MNVWTYAASIRDPERLRVVTNIADCIFCNCEMELGSYLHWPPGSQQWMYGSYSEASEVVCPQCGWWSAHSYETTVTRKAKQGWFRSIRKGAAGKLLSLDCPDIQAPLDEVRTFLLAKYESRFEVHWRLLEETVASVFRDLGYQARVTGRSNDGGIDVVLDGADNVSIGVQVKRYRDKVQADQIREFTGALVCQGLTRGIFVTTSDFTEGAVRTADTALARGYPIELVNATTFYDALKLAQTTATGKSVEELISQRPVLILIDETEEFRPLEATPIWDPATSSGFGVRDLLYATCKVIDTKFAERVRRFL